MQSRFSVDAALLIGRTHVATRAAVFGRADVDLATIRPLTIAIAIALLAKHATNTAITSVCTIWIVDIVASVDWIASHAARAAILGIVIGIAAHASAVDEADWASTGGERLLLVLKHARLVRIRALVSTAAAMVIVENSDFTTIVRKPVAIERSGTARKRAGSLGAHERVEGAPGTGVTAGAAVVHVRPEVHVAREARIRAGHPTRRALVRGAVRDEAGLGVRSGVDGGEGRWRRRRHDGEALVDGRAAPPQHHRHRREGRHGDTSLHRSPQSWRAAGVGRR